MKPRTSLITMMILAAAAARLLPHYPNATPIAAMALFGGACFANRWLAACIPLMAMLVSDLIIGFHSTQIVVYGCFLIITGLGMALKSRRHQPLWIGGATLASSLLFFLVTNFAVWAVGTMYPHTFGGLITCYVAGAAFIQYEGQTYNFLLSQIGGDVFYTTLLFGALALAEARWPGLRESPVTSPISQ